MMKSISLLLFALVFSAAAASQETAPAPSSPAPSSPAPSSKDELPSAPSAVVLKKQAPAQPPAAQPQPAQQDEAATQPAQSGSQPAPAQADAPAPSSAPGMPPPDSSIAAEAATSSSPQPPPGNNANDDPLTTIRTRAEEVNVVFTVTDKKGRFVRDLKREDFRFFDNEHPVSEIRNFSSQTNLPLRVGLLIDASNSIRDRFRFEQEAAIEFLNQILSHRTDLAFVVGFDTAAEITQDFTNNVEKLSRGVRLLRPGGGTALYDAIYFAARDKLKDVDQRRGPVRKAIILLSDGDDNQSRVTREEAIEMAQRAEVVIYSISTNVSANKGRGDKVLERIAEATGGRVFFPYKAQDVANAFEEIRDELRSQYAVAYKPADFVANGSFRSIEIKPLEKKHRVRARKGYFAPKDAQ